MISGGDAVTAALALGTLVAVGAKAVDKAYQEHKEHKMIAEAKAINEIHKKTMAKVTVKVRRVTYEVTSPPIFEFDEKTNLPKSIKMTPEFIAAMDDTIPQYRDAQSMRYSIPISRAMSALNEWSYARIHIRTFEKGSPEDLTTAVLTYLIVMLNTHCYNVQRQADAQAYLEGMCKFITEFSYMKKRGESDRSDNLGIAYHDLLVASSLLYQHSLTLSYRETFNELVPRLSGLANKLIKSASALIISRKHHLLYRDSKDRIRDLTAFLTNDKIANGIIRYQFKHAHTMTQHEALLFQQSPLTDWLKEVAKNADLSVKIEIDPEDKDDFILDDKFVTTFTQKDEENINSLFNSCENFLTRQAAFKGLGQTPEWTVVSGEERAKRVRDYFFLIMLVKKINKLVYYTSYLANMVEQIGEIYFDNPHHCVVIFKVLQGLNQQLGKNATDLLSLLTEIEKANNNLMPRPENQKLLDDLKSWLHKIISEVGEEITDLYETHKKHPKVKDADFDVVTKGRPHKVLELALALADQAGLDIPELKKLKMYSSRRLSQTSLHKRQESEESSESKSSPVITPPSPPVSPARLKKPVVVTTESPVIVPLEKKSLEQKNNESKNLIEHKNTEQKNAEQKNAPRIEVTESVETLLNSIERRIIQIESDDAIYIDTYKKAHASLTSLNQRASAIEHDSALRRLKADRIQTLVKSLAADFKTFLNYNNTLERQNHAYNLLKGIDSKLNKIDSAFLDVQKRRINFFSTRSRKFADEFSASCHHIVGLRAV